MMKRIYKFKGYIKTGDVSRPIPLVDVSWEGGIICQFTGFLDKEGIEIYEDDILEDSNGDRFVMSRWMAPAMKYQEKAWNIVGNVHQNKELLDEGI